MYRFFKNIINTLIIILAFIGAFALYKNYSDFKISEAFSNIFSANKEKIEAEVGDFTQVNDEFKINTAVKVMGYKTVIAKHPNSGQKMIIVDSGKKTLLTENDITGAHIKEKLEDLCHKFKYHSATVDSIQITDRGYMTTYGKRVPYVKFNAKVSNLPMSNLSGIISVVDSDKNNKRLILSINDKKHYSQLITSEFYKSVAESKISK